MFHALTTVVRLIRKISGELEKNAVNRVYENGGRIKVCSATNGALHSSNGNVATWLKLDLNGNAKSKIISNGCHPKTLKTRSDKMNGISTQNVEQSGHFSQFEELTAGFVLTVCTYVRPDVSALLLFVILPQLLDVLTKYTLRPCLCVIMYRLSYLITGCLLALTIGVADDFISYGSFVISPLQWIRFNIFSDLSSKLFGASGFSFYFKKVIFYDWPSVILFCVCFISFMLQICNRTNSYRLTLQMSFTASSLFILYSLHGHKELRFIHDVLPLMFILYSLSTIHVFKYFIFNNILSQKHCKTVSYILLAIFLTSQWRQFPSHADNSNKSWTYMGNTDSNHVNLCLDFISRQSDVTGVFLDRSIHMSGAYCILHHNVSILTLIHKEFKEFDATNSRFSTSSTVSHKTRVSVSVHSKVTDFISVYNTPYLLKVLINNRDYNYLVMKSDRKFIEFGYKEVYRSGSMRVLKRLYDDDEEKRLRETASAITLGECARILNYESSWLLTFNLYGLAKSKLLHSLKLDPQNIRTLQLLMELYKRRNDIHSAERVLKYCLSIHNQTECREQPTRDILHEEYRTPTIMHANI